MITIQPYRQEALEAGYRALHGRISIDFDQFSEALSSWEVKAFHDGDETVGMLMQRGNEVHVAVVPEVRGKWLSRRLIREVFGPIIEANGDWQTEVTEDNETGKDLVKRIRKGLESGEFDPVTALVGGSAVAGGAGAIGSILASRTQAKAGQAAIGEQQREFDIIQSELAPYREAGVAALGDLTKMTTPGGTSAQDVMSQDPGYQFRLSQGTEALQSSASARGTQLSGATLKELLKFGQDYASGEFQNVFNRKATIAGMGQGATNVSATTGTATASNIANTMTGIGNVQGAGIQGAFGAIGGAAQNYGNTMLLSSVLNKNQGNTVTPFSSPSTFDYSTAPG